MGKEISDQPDMTVSLDGGLTYQPAPNGVRVIYHNPQLELDEYKQVKLHVNLTSEGMIRDVWGRDHEDVDRNLGTSSVDLDTIVAELIDEE